MTVLKGPALAAAIAARADDLAAYRAFLATTALNRDNWSPSLMMAVTGAEAAMTAAIAAARTRDIDA